MLRPTQPLDSSERQTMSTPLSRWALPLALLCAASIAAADTATLEEALVLGPLPAPPELVETPRVAASTSLVPEIDPRGWLPADEERVSLAPGLDWSWRYVKAGAAGFRLEGAGVYWLAARLTSDRWAELSLSASGADSLFADGRALGGGATGVLAVGRGARFVFARAVVEAGGATISISAEGEAELGWDLDARLSLSDLDRARAIASISDIAVSPGGALVARRLSRRDPEGEGRRGEVSVVAELGERRSNGLGGPDARPVAFTPGGDALLLRRPGGGGTDLLLWEVPAWEVSTGPIRTVLSGEPGLGLIKIGPDGQRLLIVSTRGLDPHERDADAPRRWDVLRERVLDWDPLPHLHLIELETGARRVLTRPGDWTLDDAAFSSDGSSVLYGRTRPQSERPWFLTEIRHLDLATGEDRLIAEFTGGWEVRPQAFAPHPDGRRLAFLGPPHQVGDAHPEHSIYNKQVWMLDLDSGHYERVTRDQRYAYFGGRNLPAWEPGGRSLLLPANAGSRNVLVRLEPVEGTWRAQEIATAHEHIGSIAASPHATAVAFVAGGPTAPAALFRKVLVRGPGAWEAPNAALAGRFRWSPALDASFRGPGGEEIEAWWYRPLSPRAELPEADPEPASVPLIVYYYGGNSPVTRGFNVTHQFWAANGYAVLVINPRGAYGYGEAFADHHAGDGGQAAGDDVLAGTRALLERTPELDPTSVGCYGGSYGGFLTMHLVGRSDLFAAACSMYGIADQATYWGQGTWGWTYGDMANAGALPWRDPEFYLRASPLFQADGIRTPLLLLHGEADANVTPGESWEMFTALKVLGREAEMVTFPGEGHGIAGRWASDVAHRTMMLEWFDAWLKGRPQAWEHRWR